MGWKKIILCIIPVIILFSIILIISEGQNNKLEIGGADKFKTNNHENMSYSELAVIASPYDYKNLLENFDDYSGIFIFVEGEVINLHRDMIKLPDGTIVNSERGQYLKDNRNEYLLSICVDESSYFLTSTCNSIMFLDVNGIGTWLEKDKLSGYVEVVSLEEVFYSNMITGAGNTGSSVDYAPHIKEIKLRCSNC